MSNTNFTKYSDTAVCVSVYGSIVGWLRTSPRAGSVHFSILGKNGVYHEILEFKSEEEALQELIEAYK